MFEGHSHLANLLLFGIKIDEERKSQIREMFEDDPEICGGLSTTAYGDTVIRVRYRAAEVRVLRSAEDRALIDVTIREGKNREVRNMCAAAGLKVQRLLRIRQGEISLGDLPAGQWRYLTAKELEYLQSLR